MRARKEPVCYRTPYASEAIARTKINQMMRSRAKDKKYKTVSTKTYVTFQCPVCEFWHFTSKNGRG